MRALVAVVSGFVVGVFVHSVFGLGWPAIVFAFLLAGVFGGAWFTLLRGSRTSAATVDVRLPRKRAYAVCATFFIFIALGIGRALIADAPLPETFTRDLNHRVSYDGVVVAVPDLRDANQRVAIRITNDRVTTIVLAVASREPAVTVGDRVRVSGTLDLPEPFATDGGRIFRYDKYLERDGVHFLLNYAYIRVEQGAPWYSLPAFLARAKHAFTNGLQATLPEPYSSLAAGIVIGGKTGLGNDLQNAFVRSGLVQIIVLSGYNVMIVAEWIMTALAMTPLPRRWGASAGALSVLAFVGIAGFTATSVRAMLMAFVALYARATGRSYAASRALFVAIFIMLLWNPLHLVFDPGFGLSVVATAGLIWLAPIIETWLSWRGRIVENSAPLRTPSFWQNAVATTLAAQIAVLPLLLYDTGNLSLVAIPANLLIMPLMPLAMGFSALAGFAGIIFGSAAQIVGIVIALPAYLAIAYLIAVAERSASLPSAAFAIRSFPFVFTITSYAVLAWLVIMKKPFPTAKSALFSTYD